MIFFVDYRDHWIFKVIKNVKRLERTSWISCRSFMIVEQLLESPPLQRWHPDSGSSLVMRAIVIVVVWAVHWPKKGRLTSTVKDNKNSHLNILLEIFFTWKKLFQYIYILWVSYRTVLCQIWNEGKKGTVRIVKYVPQFAYSNFIFLLKCPKKMISSIINFYRSSFFSFSCSLF